MAIEINPRRTGLKLEGLPEGARLLERVARPLTGMEVKEGLRRHLRELVETQENLGHIDPDVALRFLNAGVDKLDKISEINKINIVYPGVGWRIELHKEDVEPAGNLWAEVTLDLQHDKRRQIMIGVQGLGPVVQTWEDEQLQTRVPDRIREARGMDVTVDWVKGAERGSARVARSVEVGRAATAPVVPLEPPVIPEYIGDPPTGEFVPGPQELPIEMLVGEIGGPVAAAEPVKSSVPAKGPAPVRKTSYVVAKIKADRAAAKAALTKEKSDG